MMTCREITELVTDYVEGRMSLMDRAQFRLHIGMCEPCRRYLQQMEEARALTGKLPAEPIPEDVKGELLSRFRDWKRGRT